MDYYNEDFLMHYGVKGMKWGVRRYQNKDGSLTEAGKERLYRDVKKVYNKYSYATDTARARKIYGNQLLSGMHETLKEKREVLEKADYLSKEFQSNKDLYYKYMKKAYGAAVKKNGGDPNDRSELDWEASMDMDNNMDYYEGGRAFKLYLKDKGVNLQQYSDRVLKAESDYMDECQKMVKNMLGDIGDQPLSSYDKYSSIVTSALIQKAEDEWDSKRLFTRGYALDY